MLCYAIHLSSPHDPHRPPPPYFTTTHLAPLTQSQHHFSKLTHSRFTLDQKTHIRTPNNTNFILISSYRPIPPEGRFSPSHNTPFILLHLTPLQKGTSKPPTIDETRQLPTKINATLICYTPTTMQRDCQQDRKPKKRASGDVGVKKSRRGIPRLQRVQDKLLNRTWREETSKTPYAAPMTISLPFMLFHSTNAAPKMDTAAAATLT